MHQQFVLLRKTHTRKTHVSKGFITSFTALNVFVFYRLAFPEFPRIKKQSELFEKFLLKLNRRYPFHVQFPVYSPPVCQVYLTPKKQLAAVTIIDMKYLWTVTCFHASSVSIPPYSPLPVRRI